MSASLQTLESVLARTESTSPFEAETAARTALRLIAALEPTFLVPAGTPFRYVYRRDWPQTKPSPSTLKQDLHFYASALEQPQALAHGWICWGATNYLYFVRARAVRVRV